MRTAFGLVICCCLAAAGCARPYILSPYGSPLGFQNMPRGGLHAGMDFGDTYGAPVLAAADGRVLSMREAAKGCGISVLLFHEPFGRYTLYCHLSEHRVRRGQQVKRGEVIGSVGTTGNAANRPHVHFELCTRACPLGHRDDDLEGTENPTDHLAGCFRPETLYPADRFLLTYPVRCEPA